MGKKPFASGKGETVSDVDMAADIASRLVQRESRGPGDLDNAMRRLEARYGVDYRLLWSLRYRRPKDILLGHWRRLLAAYEAECERQRAHYEHELHTTRALRSGTDTPLIRAAAALGRTADSLAGTPESEAGPETEGEAP